MSVLELQIDIRFTFSNPKFLLSLGVNFFEIGTNRSMQESVNILQHTTPILHIALNQVGNMTERQLAFVDKNKDLFLVNVKASNKILSKIGGQIQSICWHVECNMLAAIQDIKLLVWYCPGAAVFNQQLLRMSSLQYDSAELGRSPRLVDFNESSVSVRRADGSLLNIPVSPYPAVLHDHVMVSKWNEAIKLCRLIQVSSVKGEQYHNMNLIKKLFRIRHFGLVWLL